MAAEQSNPSPDNGDDHEDLDEVVGDGQMHDAWTTLPAPERRDYVLSEIGAGRWLGLLRQPVDSDLLDCIAAVRAIQADDYDALSLILRNGNAGAMLITALKMLSEAAADQGISPDFLAVWGSHSLARSS